MELRLVPTHLHGTFRTKSKWRHQTVHLERVAQENQLELRSLCHTISGLRRPCSRLINENQDGAETCSSAPARHLPHESKWRHQTVHLERVAQENQLELRSLRHTISGLRR